jgi:hypothetical protein
MRCCSSRLNITGRCQPSSRMHWMSVPGRMDAASGTESLEQSSVARRRAIGAFGANHHLRQSLVFLNMPTMQQPEAYVGYVHKLFDEHGNLINDGTRKFLQEFMQAFANWVETIRSEGHRI